MKRKRILVVLLVLLLAMSGSVTAAEPATAPDLIVTAIDWQGDGQVQPGTTLNFSVTVKNQGTAAVSDPFTVDIGFGTERLFQLTHAKGLAVGGEVTLTSPAWTATGGDRMVTARVNSTDTVTEVVERWDNDVLQRNLRVADDRYEPAYDAVRDDVAEAGMFDLTFNDDFNDTVAFDVGKTGKEGYKWYCRRHVSVPTLNMAECRAENGILTMDCKIDTFAVGAATIDRMTGVGYTFTHGYLEFRLRMPVVGGRDESKTAIWSFPRERYTEKEAFDTHVEMDWLEYYGDNYYTVTLHEITYDNGDSHWYASDKGYFNGLGDQQWHTMGYLWEEGSLKCYLDGELFHTQTWGPDEIPVPLNVVKAGDIRFDGVFSYADTQDMMLFLFGSQTIPLELDYVRIWQYGGDAPAVETPTTTATTTTATKSATTTAKPATTTVQTSSATTTRRPTGPDTVVTEPTTTSSADETTTTAFDTAPTATTTATATQAVGAAPPSGGGGGGWLIALIVAAVLALGGVLAWWIIKKKSHPKL